MPHPLPPPAAILVEGLLLVGAGLAVGTRPARRALAWLLSIAVLAVPWLLDADPWLRGLLGLASLFGVLRTIETTRPRAPERDPLLRTMPYVLPLDGPSLRRAPPSLDVALVGRALLHGVVGAIGSGVVMLAPHAGAAQPLARVLGGVIALYGYVDALASGLRALLGALGFSVAPLQLHPVLSESIGEFWGRRWNRAVGEWLRMSCFAPVARAHGVLAGTALAFVVSALIHVWPTWIAVGLEPALAMGSFFVVQGALVALESKLRVARWRRPARLAWTWLGLLVPSPLFVIPLLMMFGAW